LGDRRAFRVGMDIVVQEYLNEQWFSGAIAGAKGISI
jgi:hypothetical protein